MIATGSSPVLSRRRAKALGDRLVVNDDVFEWTDLPRSRRGLRPRRHRPRARAGARIASACASWCFGRGGRVGPLTDPVLLAPARRRLRRGVLPRPRRARRGRRSRRATRSSCAIATSTASSASSTSTTCSPRPGRESERGALDLERDVARLQRPRACRTSTARRCNADRRLSSSPAMPTTTSRCCTKPPTRAASPARTRRAIPRSARACAAHRWASCSPTRRSPSSAAGYAAIATSRHVTGVVSFEDQGRVTGDAAQPRPPARLRRRRERARSSAPR